MMYMTNKKTESSLRLNSSDFAFYDQDDDIESTMKDFYIIFADSEKHYLVDQIWRNLIRTTVTLIYPIFDMLSRKAFGNRCVQLFNRYLLYFRAFFKIVLQFLFRKFIIKKQTNNQKRKQTYTQKTKHKNSNDKKTTAPPTPPPKKKS